MGTRSGQTQSAEEVEESPAEDTQNSDNTLPPSEVRFAVVMYGGISLAIYIYGVAKELYSLVRATSGANHLSAVEKIYKELGDHTGKKFVVDIISGTSAGGINGICLAKALANNQSLDKLRDIWVEKGDVQTLLNDKESLKKLLGKNQKDLTKLLEQHQPAALFNGQLYYYLLLDGIHQMEDPRGKEFSQFRTTTNETKSDLISEDLDLFITATDIFGREVQVSADNPNIKERKYRNVFHFNYRPGNNDFHWENDPILAFAARSTSAIPPAFEPMCLRDAAPLMKIMGFKPLKLSEKTDADESQNDYASFFPSHPEDYLDIRFGDGGYLDNKPFSYAIDEISGRIADVPVDRKLIYIEPNPSIEPDRDRKSKINIIESSNAGLFLARTEPIREDLDRITQRNRVLEQLDSIKKHQENFEESIHDNQRAAGYKFYEDFPKTGLKDSMERMGHTYGAYLLLRFDSTLKYFSKILASKLELNPKSRIFTSAFNTFKSYVGMKFKAENIVKNYKDCTVNQGTLNTFLYKFDLSWRIRRCNYLLAKIDDLYKLDNQANKIIRQGFSLWHAQKEVSNGSKLRSTYNTVSQRVNEILEKELFNDEQSHLIFRAALLIHKRAINDAYTHLNKMKDFLTEPTHHLESYFTSNKARGGEDYNQLFSNLSDSTNNFLIEDGSIEASKLKSFLESVCKLSEKCKEIASLEHLFKEKVNRSENTLTPAEKEVYRIKKQAPESTERIANIILKQFFDDFQIYDPVTFPILNAHNLGEIDKVEIIRVSPLDANNLGGEKFKVVEDKLAGTSLGSFGAFFEREWRVNDIRWGRLDAAEILIKSLLLNDSDLQENLIKEAHSAILVEELGHSGQEELGKLLANTLAQANEKLDTITKYETEIQTQKDNVSTLKEERIRLRGEKENLTSKMRAEDNFYERQKIDKEILEVNKNINTAEKSEGSSKKDIQTLESSINDIRQSLRKDLSDHVSEEPRSRLATILAANLKGKEIRDYFVDSFHVDRSFQLVPTLQTSTRTVKVLGNLMKELAKEYNIKQQQVAWVFRVGQVLSGVLQVVIPDSLWNRFTRFRLFPLFYTLLFLNILYNFVANFFRTEPSRLGWAPLIATIVAQILFTWIWTKLQRQERMSKLIQKSNFREKIVQYSFIVILILLITMLVLGGFRLAELFPIYFVRFFETIKSFFN